MTSSATIRIARVIRNTTAEGPGTRFAVWVQGCQIRCTGCFNPHMWSQVGGTPTDPQELAHQAIASGAQGVTLLGGEPFEQPTGLAAFATSVAKAGLSVMTFTGHTIEDLRNMSTGNPDVLDLLSATDLLVDGPYLAEQPDLKRPWVGSINQRFQFLTDRYRHLEPDLGDLPDRIEVRILPDGTASLNGWASVDGLDALLTGTGLPSPKRGSVR